jgi:hypothetical protein
VVSLLVDQDSARVVEQFAFSLSAFLSGEQLSGGEDVSRAAVLSLVLPELNVVQQELSLVVESEGWQLVESPASVPLVGFVLH